MISPVEQFGTIGRTQDFSIMKHQEDTKVSAQQVLIESTVEKNTQDKVNQVRTADDTQMTQNRFDAKEEGKNAYQSDGGKQRKNQKEPDGKVVLKGVSSFDMKI